MAGEGLGLAYQASRPIENKTYDIIKEQIAYIEEKKGLREAAKRQAEIERAKRTSAFYKDNPLTMPEATGFIAKYQQDIGKVASDNYKRAGYLIDQGNIHEGYALLNQTKAGLNAFKNLDTLIRNSPEEMAKAIYGAEFEMSEELNLGKVNSINKYLTANMSYTMDETGQLIVNENVDGETVSRPADEVITLLSGGFRPKGDIGAMGVSFAKNFKQSLTTGGKYDKKTYVNRWDGEEKKGQITGKQAALLDFNSKSTKKNPMPEFETYVVRKSGNEPYDPDMSDIIYSLFVDDFIESTYRPAIESSFSDESDPLGAQNTKANTAYTNKRTAYVGVTTSKEEEEGVPTAVLENSGLPIAGASIGGNSLNFTHSRVLDPIESGFTDVIHGYMISDDDTVYVLKRNKYSQEEKIEAATTSEMSSINISLGANNTDELKAKSHENYVVP